MVITIHFLFIAVLRYYRLCIDLSCILMFQDLCLVKKTRLLCQSRFVFILVTLPIYWMYRGRKITSSYHHLWIKQFVCGTYHGKNAYVVSNILISLPLFAFILEMTGKKVKLILYVVF